MLHALRYYLQIVGTKRTSFTIGLTVLLVANLYQLVPPVVIGAIAENLASPEPDHRYLMLLSLLFGGSFTVVSLIRLQTKRYLETIRIKNDLAIRQESFRALIHNPDARQGADSGAYIQTLNQGISALFDFGAIVQNEGMKAIVISFGLTALLTFYAWPLALVSILYITLFYLQASYFKTRLQDLEREKLAVQSQTSASIVNTIEGTRTLRAFKLSQRIHARTETKNEVLYRIDRELQKNAFRLWQIFQCMNGVFFAIAIWQICQLASVGLMSITLTITLIGYVQAFVSTFADILSIWTRLQTSIVGLRRLESIYKPSTKTQSSEVVHGTFATWHTLSLSDITYTYPGAPHPVLSRKNLTLHRGVHTLIKGPSGSGKSTLAKILAGTHAPDSGTITLDGIGLSTDDLSRLVAFAMQEVQIFTLSLKENITLCADVPEDKLDLVTRICRLEPLVAKMPQGIDTIIGGNEWLLSGGELLRVSLARALLLAPSILILDETTSMIEFSLETEILRDLRLHFPDMTLVLISHQDHPREWIGNEISTL